MIVTSSCRGDSRALPDNVCLTSPDQPIPHVPVSGIKVDNYDNPSLMVGSVTDFGFAVYGDALVFADRNGNAFISNAIAPAYWNFEWLMPYDCGLKNFMGGFTYDQANLWEYGFTRYPAPNYATNHWDSERYLL